MSLNDQIREATEALSRRLREKFDAEVTRLAERLSASLEADRAADLASALEKARTEARQEREAAVEQVLATVSERLEAARVEAEARLGTERDQLVEAARAEARLEAERRLESEVTRARAAERRLGEVEVAARAEAQSEATVASAKAEETGVLEKQLAASRVDADRRLEAEVARLQAQHEVALERALAESQTQIAEAVDAALAEDVQDDVSPMWAASEGEGGDGVSAQSVRRRSLNAVRGLDAATSLTGLLDGLLVAVGADAERAVVLVLRGGRLCGWGADSFGDSMGEPRSFELAPDSSDIIGRAMADARAVTSRPEERGPDGVVSLPAFARLPTGCVAVAAPVMVGGRAVGAVYADDAGDTRRTTSSGWLEAVELLTIHASRCAESLTAARAVDLLGAPTGDAVAASLAGNSEGDGGVQAARRYARLLVSEIRLYNEDAVQSGREHRDLAHRLRAEIAHARELFAERTPADLPLAEALFTEELVRTLADSDDSLMGNDEPGAL